MYGTMVLGTVPSSTRLYACAFNFSVPSEAFKNKIPEKIKAKNLIDLII
jgi:hypothetical protein